MKHVLYLLSLVTSQCVACELVSIDTMRNDVEAAFAAKSFAEFSTKHGESRSIELKLEDEYAEENPITIFKFSGAGEFSRWFQERHQYTEHMLISEQVVCSDFGDEFGCDYELPALTLHHGTYLLGFRARREGQCTSLSQVYIYWG